MSKSLQQNERRAFRSLPCLHARNGGAVQHEIIGETLLRPTQSLAQSSDVDDVVHAAYRAQHTDRCQGETHASGVHNARMPRKQGEVPLTEQAARLREARAKRGFASASAAAAFFGWNETTYSQHERGERGLTRAAARYAKGLRVATGWLLTGEGSADSSAVEVFGRIGAGSVVTMAGDGAEIASGQSVALPTAAECWAFVVEGDSMRPRFFPGEIVVFEREPAETAGLVGQYCLAQVKETGDRFVKILRKSRADRWRLESHNADPMEDVELLAAWRWRATLPARDGTATLVPAEATKRRKT